MARRIRFRRGTAVNWAATNPVLAQGEPGIETDTGLSKNGDGVTPWSERPYAAATPAQLEFEASARGAALSGLSQVGGHAANPVIPYGAGGTSDEGIREIGNVLFNAADSFPFRTLYSGYTGAYSGTNVFAHAARSLNGVTWEKQGIVIADRSLEDPWVIKVGTRWHAYFEDKTGGATSIRKYHSDDFSTWVDDDVVLGPSGVVGAWDANDVSSPVVVIEDGTWHLFYEGRAPGQQGAVGHATSGDGMTWVRDSANPVVSASASAAWVDEVTIPWATHLVSDDVMFEAGTWYMFTHAYDGEAWRIAAVTAPSLAGPWTSFRGNLGNPIQVDDIFPGETLQSVRVQNRVIFYYRGSAGINRGYPAAVTLPSLSLDTVVPKTSSQEWVPASRFVATVGAPNLVVAGGRWGTFMMDAAVQETITASVLVPDFWTTMQILLYWSNVGAGAGAIRLVTQLDLGADGQLLTASGGVGAASQTLEAPAQNTLKVSELFASVAVPASRFVGIRPSRLGSDASDTLPNDAGILGVLLKRVS